MHSFIKWHHGVNKLFFTVCSQQLVLWWTMMCWPGYLTHEEFFCTLWWCMNITITVHLIFWFMVLPCGRQIHKYICHLCSVWDWCVWTAAHQVLCSMSHVLQYIMWRAIIFALGSLATHLICTNDTLIKKIKACQHCLTYLQTFLT